MQGSSVVVVEPTYADGEHGPGNAGLLQAVSLACGPVPFASTSVQRAAVRESLPSTVAVSAWHDINVLPPGGITLRRMRAQWQALSGVMRAFAPRALVLLSAGPETLFVARGLATRHRDLQIYAVMHGNLATLTGWRSRDPRRRLIDLHAGMRLARHPRIHLVVLEHYIREAAERLRLADRFLVWPNIVPDGESPAATAWMPGRKLRIAFVGTGNRPKGFDDFLALREAAPSPDYGWALVGQADREFQADRLAGIDISHGRLSRTDFLQQLRRADFAFMSFKPAYQLISSGSLLDCIIQRKPVIAIDHSVLTSLARQYGPIGHLCADLQAARALLADPARLRDAAAYATFQRSLDAIAADRRPEVLAGIIARDLGC